MDRIALKKIPIEEFISLLKKDGIEVDYEDAEQILHLLHHYVQLIISECFEDYLPQI